MKCKALTLKGTRCKYNARKQSDYCLVHGIYHNAKTQFLTNLTLTIILFICAVFVTIIIAKYYYNSSKEDQKISSNKIERKLNQDGYLRERKMLFIYQTNYKELKQRYPLGFTLVSADYDKAFIPHESPVSYEFDIIWESAKIVNKTDKHIAFRLPDVKWKNNRYGGNMSIFPRKIGKLFSPLTFGNIGMVIELLVDDSQGFIFIVAFKERGK